MYRTIRTSTLEIAYLESGPASGPAVILMHGWPSDAHDWERVAERLARDGFRALVPYLRGFGPTRFLAAATPRSGQQAAIGADLRDFMDALGIDRAVLGGYDWGGRAACGVAALWPERVRGLLTIGGYQIQNIAAAGRRPADAMQEYRYWYQWYFHTARGREGLTRNRREIARLLWRLWSPNWNFDEATFAATAASFDNPDYVDVTVNSYCHRYGNAPGDPAFDELERLLAAQPRIDVPTIVLHGAADGVSPPEHSEGNAKYFGTRYQRRVVPVAGHFLSRETPEAAVEAIRELAI
jgi:pimeloyl-ACP methyl ester carboxylesterase